MSKNRIIILHWYKCAPDSFCLPRLQNQLQEKDYEVIIPALPNTNLIALDEKVDFLIANYIFDTNAILMWISLWSMVWLKLLEKYDIHIKQFISVAGAFEFEMNESKRTEAKFEDYRNYLAKNWQPIWNWTTILSKSDDFQVILALWDKTVSNWNSIKLAGFLWAHPIIVHSEKDHFRWVEEKELLASIINIL